MATGTCLCGANVVHSAMLSSRPLAQPLGTMLYAFSWSALEACNAASLK